MPSMSTTPYLTRLSVTAVLHFLLSTQVSSFKVNEVQDLNEVVQRMKYWREGNPALIQSKAQRKYLVLEQDGAGVNNKRICWEMAGLVAFLTGRTLVLPPNEAWWAIDEDGSSTKTEDFINLAQLRGGLSVLTFKEFADKEQKKLNLPDYIVTADGELNWDQRQNWREWAWQNLPNPGTDRDSYCDLSKYKGDQVALLANHNMEGRLLGCEKWWSLGEPDMTENGTPLAVPDSGYALLRNHFVWNEDVFKLAAPVVQQLGLFGYVALHARFNDWKEFDPDGMQSAEQIMGKWVNPSGEMALLQTSIKANHRQQMIGGEKEDLERMRMRATSRAQTLISKYAHFVKKGMKFYISTDETDQHFIQTFRDHGIDAYWSKDFFDKDESPIASLIAGDRERTNKIKGCVEQVICTFGKIFIGTHKSTFSGYITRMRIYANAPQKGLSEQTRLFHTVAPTEDVQGAVDEEIRLWEAQHGITYVNKDDAGVF